MMPTLQLSAPAMAQDVPAVQGGAASLTDIAAWRPLSSAPSPGSGR
jgi:hypothetical protein